MRRSRAGMEARLPSGEARELLREKGQFWTPDWVADAMVRFALAGGATEVFDPAVGAGAFFRAARRHRPAVGLRGCEISAAALAEARDSGLKPEDLHRVEFRDFVLDPPPGQFAAVVANPPYIRHHRIGPLAKARLRRLAVETIGVPLDGRAGLHAYFLVRALSRLAPGGRLAFLVPADTCEGKYASALWAWISREFRIDAVLTFSVEAAPFPQIDTNALVLMIRRVAPRGKMVWAACRERASPGLLSWATRPHPLESGSLLAVERPLDEALATGMSRVPNPGADCAARLADYCAVVRGIATGANDFFFLTAKEARSTGIPPDLLKRAIGRTRDVTGDRVTHADLERLDAAGRPTYLLALGASPADALPEAVARYLAKGTEAGLPDRTLLATRRPWYKWEARTPPPFLFAYLGRRSARFIRNDARVVPLTAFLCVYARQGVKADVDALWAVLSHPATLANLKAVGKSYGSGAIKVEPRALERLPLPEVALREAGLAPPPRVPSQVALPFAPAAPAGY